MGACVASKPANMHSGDVSTAKRTHVAAAAATTTTTTATPAATPAAATPAAAGAAGGPSASAGATSASAATASAASAASDEVVPSVATPFIVYADQLCPFSRQCVYALAARRIPFRFVTVDLAALPEWFVKVNPARTVPVVCMHVAGDASHRYMTESPEILKEVEAYAAPADHQQELVSITTAESSEAIKKLQAFQMSVVGVIRTRDDWAVPQVMSSCATQLRWLNDLIGDKPFIAGDKVTMADCRFLPWVERLSCVCTHLADSSSATVEFVSGGPLPNVMAWMARARDSFGEHAMNLQFTANALRGMVRPGPMFAMLLVHFAMLEGGRRLSSSVAARDAKAALRVARDFLVMFIEHANHEEMPGGMFEWVETKKPGATKASHEEHENIDAGVAKLVELTDALEREPTEESLVAMETAWKPLRELVEAHLRNEAETLSPILVKTAGPDEQMAKLGAFMAASQGEAAQKFFGAVIAHLLPAAQAKFAQRVLAAMPSRKEEIVKAFTSRLDDDSLATLRKACPAVA